MSWFDRRPARRPAAGAATAPVAVLALALAAGCSLTPVYQHTAGADPAVINRIAYAEPAGRAEQVVYQALKFALGEGRGAALVLDLDVSSDIAAVSAIASDDPATPYALTLTAAFTLSDAADPSLVRLRDTRSASATFTRGPQQIANQAAERDATERAARRLAEIIRARLLAYLATGQ